MIKDNQLVGAISKPSPNFNNRAITPIFIVMHYTAGWTAESAIRTFSSPSSNVSANLTIDTDGTVFQHVDFDKRAWHAGPSHWEGYNDLNSHAIGIEMVNPGWLRKVDGGYTDSFGNFKTEKAVGKTIAAECPRAGSGMFYWPIYPKAQLEKAEEIVRELIDVYDIIDVVSHEQIDKRGWKTDPGPAFPLNRFKALVPHRDQAMLQYEVTANILNVRSGPGTEFEVRDTLRHGDIVSALDHRDPWVRVSADGWVHGSFLRRKV